MTVKGSVAIRGAVKRHGATTVLHGIDLDVAAGEFFVLLGPSGSGKTTTLRILAGLESLSAGQVLMDGVDVTHQEPGQRDVAMVFQSYALYPHMTALVRRSSPPRCMRRRRRSALRTSWSAGRASCRVGSSSAWHSRVRLFVHRGCSCSTSLCPTWTPSCAWKRGSS
jgi:ABC-type polar amino acid transport system ATPase subunit